MFYRLVWMIEEETTAELVSFCAHSYRVQFTSNGIHYDEIVMNEDFILLDDLGVNYEFVED